MEYNYLKQQLELKEGTNITEISDNQNILSIDFTAQAFELLSDIDGIVVEEDAEMVACGQAMEGGENKSERNMQMIHAVPD